MAGLSIVVTSEVGMQLYTLDINLPVIIIVAVAALLLIIFLLKRNVKDKKDFEETVNQVEKKPFEDQVD